MAKGACGGKCFKGSKKRRVKHDLLAQSVFKPGQPAELLVERLKIIFIISYVPHRVAFMVFRLGTEGAGRAAGHSFPAMVKIPVVDDEPDVPLLFTQRVRHEIRSGALGLAFAHSGEQVY